MAILLLLVFWHPHGKNVLSFYPCKGMLLVVVLHMYIPLYILAQCRALESTVAISLKSAN